MPSGSKRNKKDKSINKLIKNNCSKGSIDKESQKPQQTMFDASLKILDKLFKESNASDILKLGPRPELLGMTPLAMAASVGNVEAVVKLLTAEADVNEKSDKNTTALMQVIHSKNIEIAQLLLKEGARLTDTNTTGDNAFMMAVWSGETDLVNKMWPYRQNLDINHQNKAGNTALHLAASRKLENCIHFLLTNGADTNLQNKAGITPLMTAVKQGDMKAVEKIVIHSNTDLLIEDSKGHTALCKAILNEKRDAAQVITKKLTGLDKIVLSQNLVTKLLKPPEDCNNHVGFYEESLYPVLLTMCRFDEFRSALSSCKLIGHVINIAAKHVTSSQIVTASCFICTLLMFKYSSGTDERFVDQFMVCKGPEFVLHVLKIYENLENGLSQDSEVMAGCILTLVPVSEAKIGKEWIKQNSQIMSKYIERLKVSNVMSKLTFIDEGCRCKLKIAWKEFVKLYEDAIDRQRQRNITQLLEEEEREKIRKTKKKDRRKTKKKKQDKKQNIDDVVLKETVAINENNHSKVTPQSKDDNKIPTNAKYQPLKYDNFDDKSDLDEPLEFGFTVELGTLTEDDWVTVSTKKPATKPASKSTPQKQATSAKQELCKPTIQKPKKEKVESIKVKDGNMSWADIARSNIQSTERQTDMSSPSKSCTVSPASSVHDYPLEDTKEEALSEEENVATIDIESEVPEAQVSDPNLYKHDFPPLKDGIDSIWEPCTIDTGCPTPIAADSSSAYSAMISPENVNRQADDHAASSRPPPGFSEIRPTENWWDNMNTLNFPSFGFQPNQTTTHPIASNDSGLSPLNQLQFMASFIEEQQRMLSVAQSNGSLATLTPNHQLLSSKPDKHTFQQNATIFPTSSVGETNSYDQTAKTCSNSFMHISTASPKMSYPMNYGQHTMDNIPQPKQLWPDHSLDFDGYLENIWKNDTIFSSGIQQTLRGAGPGQVISDTVLYPSHLRDDGSGDPETSSDYSTQSSDNTDCFPSFHDNKDCMNTSFVFEELAKEQVKKHDKKLSDYPIFRNSPNHYTTDYYKSLYGLMSNHQEAGREQEADRETSPLPEWALEPEDPDYEISAMPSFQFPNTDGSTVGYVSRKWKGKLDEIRRFPEKMKRQIGSIIIPLQSALYNINENGNSVILGHLLDGTEVAVKVIDPKLYSINFELVERLLAAEIKHNFLLKYLAIGETSNKKYIACELCDYTLEEYIHIVSLNFQHDALSANKLSWQLLKGLHYLHTEFLLPHGNLKPQNIYVDFDGKLRIGGYGVNKNHRLCRMSTAPSKKLKHEIWRATECLGDSENTVSTIGSDVQVAGMLIHYILTGGKHPYGENPYEIEVNICQNWGQVAYISEEANDLISAMMFSDMSARPSLEQCLGHPFFWSDEMKFRLVLIAGSDVLKEMKTGVPVTGSGSTTMIDFLNVVPAENISQDWMADLDSVVLKDMRSFRQYKNSLAELVLFLYNCCLHFDKMSPAAREVMDDPCRYFPDKFPNLFMAVYRAIKVSDRVSRTCYKPFYYHCY